MANKGLPTIDVRRMQRSQLSNYKKDELINGILASQEEESPGMRGVEEMIAALRAEVADLRAAMTSPESFITKKFAEMQQKVDRQADIIASQQRFLETVDRKEREMNVVVLGLPDEGEALDGAVTDAEKLVRVWTKVGVSPAECQHRRLGAQAAGGRKRPLLVTIPNKDTRSRILANAKNLKTAGEAYSRIYVKKDTHPGVRKEWHRLREVEAREKERP